MRGGPSRLVGPVKKIPSQGGGSRGVTSITRFEGETSGICENCAESEPKSQRESAGLVSFFMYPTKQGRQPQRHGRRAGFRGRLAR
jgi:hypothetical protein